MIEDVISIHAPFWGTYRLQRLRFGSGAPHLVVVAGLHGNELNGVHALNLLASCLRAQAPWGTVDLYPVVNTVGIDEGRKRGPFQDEDLNRAFPGDPRGSAVQRVAHALLQATVADVCIDVHSGSFLVREIPQVRVSAAGSELHLARAMGLPLIWRRSPPQRESSGLVGSWRALGRKALRLVAGRGGTLNKDDAETLAASLRNLMGAMNMGAGGHLAGASAEVRTEDITTHRTGTGGFFVPAVKVGDHVQPGHFLGWVAAPLGGETLEEIRADRAGLVVTLREYPMVHAQELAVRVASMPVEAERAETPIG